MSADCSKLSDAWPVTMSSAVDCCCCWSGRTYSMPAHNIVKTAHGPKSTSSTVGQATSCMAALYTQLTHPTVHYVSTEVTSKFKSIQIQHNSTKTCTV